MDSTALFTLEYRSSDTCVSGFVTLLAAMEALWRVKNMIRNTAGAKDIMFAFFHGVCRNLSFNETLLNQNDFLIPEIFFLQQLPWLHQIILSTTTKKTVMSVEVWFISLPLNLFYESRQNDLNDVKLGWERLLSSLCSPALKFVLGV